MRDLQTGVAEELELELDVVNDETLSSSSPLGSELSSPSSSGTDDGSVESVAAKVAVGLNRGRIARATRLPAGWRLIALTLAILAWLCRPTPRLLSCIPDMADSYYYYSSNERRGKKNVGLPKKRGVGKITCTEHTDSESRRRQPGARDDSNFF